MRGNFTAQSRHKVVAVRTDASAGPGPRACAALLLFAALSGHDAAARSSCPLTTSVVPFGASNSARYQVVLTDGGPGDLDGMANGFCAVAIRLCRGAEPLCDGRPILDGRVRTVGGAGGDARALVDDGVTTALEALASGAPTGDACRVARFSLAAEEDASVAFRFRIATEIDGGRTATRKSRLAVECLPPSDRPDEPACFSARGDCPDTAEPVCGDGVVDRAGEQCDGSDAEACPGACTASCTCAPGPDAPQPPGVPACGDGARNQDIERCDGGDDALCPGACNVDCTCGTESGGLNVAPLAVPSVSSSVTDAGAAIDGVVDGLPGDPEHEWISDGEGHGAWLRLAWPSPVTIDRVVLHDRPNDVDNVVDAAVLAGDDGEPVSTGPLAPDGAPTEVMIGTRTISALTFMVMEATGHSAGLAEIEVVAAKKPTTTTTTTTTVTTTTATVTTTSTTTPTSSTTVTPTTVAPTSTTTTPTTLPPTSTGAVFYLSPSGSDANSGTSADKPWKSFSKAVKALTPGATLVVGDGKYTRATTGLPVVDCANGAKSGTADQPITIRAAHERQAWLACDGIGDAFYMNKCSYWNVEGLRASSADNSGAKEWEGNVLRFYGVGNVNLRRVLAVRPNRTCPNSSLSYCNAHAIAIEKSHDVLVEEAEVYDFHRHGVSAFSSSHVTVRRCYMNPWDATGGAGGGSTGVIFYGSSDSIVENVIGEGVYGLNIAGGTVYDGTPGGYRNKVLGSVTLNAKHGSTIRARKFSGPVLPLGHNLVKDSVFVRAQNVGVFARGAADTRVENVSVFGTVVDAGVVGDEDLSEGAPCSANPEGCSISAKNLLSVGNTGQGMKVATSVMKSWSLESSDLWNNAGGNFPTSETPGDDAGNIRRSQSVAPSGMGTGSGACMLWVPDGSNMKGAGAGGADVGASILRRYQDGVLTSTRLWDPTTGAFPCGTVVAGVNDDPARTCSGVHKRLNVNTNGCRFPAAY